MYIGLSDVVMISFLAQPEVVVYIPVSGIDYHYEGIGACLPWAITQCLGLVWFTRQALIVEQSHSLARAH